MFLIAGKCGVLILSGYNKAAQKRCPFCFHKMVPLVSLYAFSQNKSCKNAVIEQPQKFIFCSAVQFRGETTKAGKTKRYAKLKREDIVAMEANSLAFVMEREMTVIGCTAIILNASQLSVIYASTKKTDKEDTRLTAAAEIPSALLNGEFCLKRKTSPFTVTCSERSVSKQVYCLEPLTSCQSSDVMV